MRAYSSDRCANTRTVIVSVRADLQRLTESIMATKTKTRAAREQAESMADKLVDKVTDTVSDVGHSSRKAARKAARLIVRADPARARSARAPRGSTVGASA